MNFLKYPLFFTEPVTSPTTSTPNPVIGNINITTTSTSVVPSHAPVQTTTVSNIITSPPISTSTSNHITTAASTHELTAFTPASTIIPTKSSDTQPTISVPTSPTQIHPQSTSLSGDVRVMSSLPQPTSTLQGETPTETLHVTPPDAHSRSSSSLRMSTVPSPLSRDLSKPTTPTMLPQPTTQPDTRDQPSLTTPTESSSMSTIVAGIAALILLLATLAGCTVIGGLAFVHCKPRPKNVGSTNDKDAEDNLSLKDISPSSSLSELVNFDC